MKNIRYPALAGLCFGASLMAPVLTPALAQEVDEIIVSATGIPTPAAQIGASVDILTADELAEMQSIYLQDALTKLAGVNSYASGGAGATSNVFLRGMTGKYSGVYVDGVQINDPVNQQASWANLPTHGLDSVEVLRGTQGVLYGSEAIGGAINLFTAYGGETKTTAAVDTGSFGTNIVSLSSQGEANPLGYGLGYGLFVQQTDTDGISAANEIDGNVEKDGYERLTGRARFVVDLSDQISVDVSLRSVSSEVDTDASGPSDSLTNYTDFDSIGGRVSLAYAAGDWQHKVSLGQTEDINSAYTFSTLTTIGSRDSLAYRGVLEFSDTVDLLIGVESESETYETSDATYETDNDALLALLQYSGDQGLSASLAVRQDDSKAFGKFDTSRFAAKQMFDRFGFRASIGTGFRAPSLYETYGLSDYCADGLCGNTQLQPEESQGHDLAVIFQPTKKSYLELASFKITVSDFIKYGTVTPQAGDACLVANSYPGNVATQCGKYEQSDGDSVSSGYELRGRIEISEQTVLSGNFTKLDAETETGARDIRRPEETWNANLSHRISERLSGNMNVQVVRKTIDTNFATYQQVDLDDYTLLNLSAAYQLSQMAKLSARVENALDDQYETALGFGTPGRAFYIGLTASF
jgi:vitamin B12 transporter